MNDKSCMLSAIDSALAELSDKILTNDEDHLDASKDFWNQTPSIADITKRYAPPCLNDEFQHLYQLLHPCLVERQNRSNVSAFLMGPRGSGKSLLLQHCLKAFREELNHRSKRCFRYVSVHGILVPGQDMVLVLQEILRQLVNQSYHQDTNLRDKLLKLRQATFTNNIQLLNEILELSSIDGIPVLICLDELDAFIKVPNTSKEAGTAAVENVGSDRQVLLYHLLERAATSGSSVCVVGLTCHFKVMNLLEKRIRSRAEGSSEILHLRLPATYEGLVEILVSKFKDESLKAQIQSFLDPPIDKRHGKVEDLLRTFQRNHAIGKDIRWFSRVLSIAIADFRAQVAITKDDTLRLSEEYFENALVDMGASFVTEIGKSDTQAVNGRSPYFQFDYIKSLPGPSLVLVLAARRMSTRASRGGKRVQITFQRMYEEYRSYKGISDRYSRPLLVRALYDLFELGIFRPASEHASLSPLMYRLDTKILDINPNLLEKLPLHLTVESNDIFTLLEKNQIKGSTALLDWAKKNHA